MEFLLCYLKPKDSLLFERRRCLKEHYKKHHKVDPKNVHFQRLFERDNNNLDGLTCSICRLNFSSNTKKKNHMFLRHYLQSPRQQVGGAIVDSRHLNILHRGKIIYFSINYNQHKGFYDFFSSDMVSDFLDNVYKAFKPLPNTKYKFHAFFELVNQQKIDSNQRLFDTRSWFTNVYHFFHFNEFVRQQFNDEILKRIIQNGQTGSSWHFFRFQSLRVIAAPLKYAQHFFKS